MTPWLSVVGIGEDGFDGLPPAARALIAAAEVLVGGQRHLALLPETSAKRLGWRSPFSDNLPLLAELRGKRVCVLASGDPMWFGVGATLLRHFPAEEITVLAHPGAFSLAAARLGWPLHEVACLTAHGRPVDALALHFHPLARLLVLSEDGGTAARLAALLEAKGYGGSAITILERLGGNRERCFPWTGGRCEDLNTLAVELNCGTAPLSRVPGLPDEAFLHDGQLTKREVRAVTLSALAPWPGAVLWDVGAGCGSVAIEWARAGGISIAIEPLPARRDMIARNAIALGVPGVTILAGAAPEVLTGIDQAPDAVFIGGGVTRPGMLAGCWEALRSGGRMVVNAVAAESEAALLAWHAAMGGEMSRLAVSRLGPTGRFHTWRPMMQVTQYFGVKP